MSLLSKTVKGEISLRDKIDKIKNIRFLAEILLFIIIAVQIVNMVFVFVNDKKEYHSDEVYSYGLSNSFYRAFVENDDVHSDKFENINEWISGDIIHDYITVQQGEQFRYDSVWHNQAQDRHPPLFYAVLHTICSFFPDEFSFWFGFIPNLVYFAITQFFLYKLAKNILKSKYLALLFCTFWGFTPAALDIVLFIRMYCMLTMWVVILIYLHSGLTLSGKTYKVRDFIPFMIVTFLGALTQYLFLFVAFVTAVCFCIWYLVNKKYKTMFMYGCSMLIGVLMFFAAFPKGIEHLFFEGTGAHGDFATQLVISLRYIFLDNFCFTQSTLVWLSVFIPPFIGILAVMSLPLLFLFRDKLHLKELPEKIKNIKISKLDFRKLLSKITSSQPVIAAMFLSIAAVVAVSSYTVSYLVGFANRYLFIIYPLLSLVVFKLFCFILEKFRFSRVSITVLTVLLLVNVIFKGSITTYWKYDNKVTPDTLFDNSNVVVVAETSIQLYSLSTFSCELYNADNIFMTDYEDLKNDMDKIANVPLKSPVYVMTYSADMRKAEEKGYLVHLAYDEESGEYSYKKTFVKEYMSEFMKLPDVSSYEYVGSFEFTSGSFLIYRMK